MTEEPTNPIPVMFSPLITVNVDPTTKQVVDVYFDMTDCYLMAAQVHGLEDDNPIVTTAADWLDERRDAADQFAEALQPPPNPQECPTCGALYGEMDHAPEPCEEQP